MADIILEQALFQCAEEETPHALARSPGFREEWLEEAAELIVAFGARPHGVRGVEALFAHPLGKDQVAVVRVREQQADSGRPSCVFHVLVVSRAAYERFFGDPFVLARRLPAAWHARDLPACALPAERLPPPTVADVQRVLKRIKAGALHEDRNPEDEPERTPENSESPALLGSVQALVDGGRVVFERPAADTGLIEDLWTLLPASTRSRLWPASYAFGNSLRFDALVVARAAGEEYEGYTREEEAAEYPAGQYEYNLQVAAEHGDQTTLDRLFNRRSWAETWRLGWTLLALVTFLAVAARVLDVLAPPPKPQPQQQEKKLDDKGKP